AAQYDDGDGEFSAGIRQYTEKTHEHGGGGEDGSVRPGDQGIGDLQQDQEAERGPPDHNGSCRPSTAKGRSSPGKVKCRSTPTKPNRRYRRQAREVCSSASGVESRQVCWAALVSSA